MVAQTRLPEISGVCTTAVGVSRCAQRPPVGLGFVLCCEVVQVNAMLVCPASLYKRPFLKRSEYVQVRIFRERGARPSVRGRFSLPENLKDSRSTTL